MNLSNIFSLPTLICLGITLLLIGGVAMFFLQRLNEQNLKIRHMVSLVSTFADELKLINQRIYVIDKNIVTLSKGEIQIDSILLKPPSLIEVSDDDDSNHSNASEEEDFSESDSDDESDSESDSDDESNFKTENVSELLENEANIKTINMGETLDIKLKSETIEYASSSVISVSEDDDDDHEDDDEDDENKNDDAIISNSDIQLVTSLNTLTSVDAFDGRVNNFLSQSDELIKSIEISTLDDNNIGNESSDYKKMSINKLKSIAIAKGLVSDSSKLKKNELVKLLEVV